jgi:hypothetical protein
MTDLTKLSAELAKDEYAELVKTGDHAAIKGLLGALTVMGTRLVPCAEVKNFALIQGIWFPIKDAAENKSTPEPLRTYCRTVIEAIDSPRYEVIDVASAQSQGMNAAIAQAGLMSPGQAAAVTALANVPISLAESQGIVGAGESVTGEEITWAWNRSEPKQ